MQKPTRAQKRREQRAAEEAEREARIEAEKAAAGPDSEKDREAAELDSLLKPLGLTIKEIPVWPFIKSKIWLRMKQWQTCCYILGDSGADHIGQNMFSLLASPINRSYLR